MFDFEDLDYYELLGLARNASADEVKRAYRREITKYHPDRFANAPAEQQEYAVQRSQRINEAYRVLSDFNQRSSYSRKQTSRPVAPAPQGQRDHLAELYEQAQRHIAAGHPLEAIAALRQLQQLNPLYRDSATLMATAKAQLQQRNRRQAAAPAAPAQNDLPRRTLIIGGVTGILAAAALAAWALGQERSAIPSTTPGEFTPEAIAAEPTNLPVATLVPTAPPTATPTPTPTRTPPPSPTPSPTSVPTVTSLPTPIPNTPLGELLLSESFDRRSWAQQDGQNWSVGYRDGRYRIAAEEGVGLIWSYRTGPAGDASYAVDLQHQGEAGLLLHFASERNYVRCTINTSGGFRVAQATSGSLVVLAEGFSQAIALGENVGNRLEARIRGDLITFSANGQALAEVQAANLSNSSRYGLVVVAEASRAEAFFDNLEIRALTP
jgi:hypothetical protein